MLLSWSTSKLHTSYIIAPVVGSYKECVGVCVGVHLILSSLCFDDHVLIKKSRTQRETKTVGNALLYFFTSSYDGRHASGTLKTTHLLLETEVQ